MHSVHKCCMKNPSQKVKRKYFSSWQRKRITLSLGSAFSLDYYYILLHEVWLSNCTSDSCECAGGYEQCTVMWGCVLCMCASVMDITIHAIDYNYYYVQHINRIECQVAKSYSLFPVHTLIGIRKWMENAANTAFVCFSVSFRTLKYVLSTWNPWYRSYTYIYVCI